MKKVKFSLLFTTICFVVLIIGIFIGRTVSRDITLPFCGTEPVQETSSTSGKININRADLSQLLLLPGIGETLARRIIAYRDTHGDFHGVDDLLQVEGIGAKKMEQIKDYISFGGDQ